MGWKFKVTKFYPEALPGPMFEPMRGPPASDEADVVAALKCRITRGAAERAFWLGKSQQGGIPVDVGGEPFWIGYNPVHHDLGFSLRLVKADQTTEIGSKLPATQTSFMELSDRDARIENEPRTRQAIRGIKQMFREDGLL